MNPAILFLLILIYSSLTLAGGDPPEPEPESEPEALVDTVRADSVIEVPIVTAERLPSNYGAVTIHSPELDSLLLIHADILFDSLESVRGILLDMRAVWKGLRAADPTQTPFFKILLDSVPKGPLTILTNPRWPGTEEMAAHAQHRPFTTFDYSGDLESGKRALKANVLKFEKGGGKTIEEMEKLREAYPDGISPIIPKQPMQERR
jgi:hypothetical protein